MLLRFREYLYFFAILIAIYFGVPSDKEVAILFCSREYLYFFTIIFAAYWAIPWQRERVWLLLGASF